MKLTLRPHQSEAVDNIMRDFKSHDEVLTIHPTGSGKSITMTALAERFMANQMMGSVLVLVPLKILHDQIIKTANGTGSLKAMSINDCAMKTPRIIVATVQSTGFDTAKRNLSRTIHDKVKLVIADECHIGDAWFDNVKEMYPEAKVANFTATPFKNNQYAFPDIPISHSVPMQQMIDEKYLVPPKLIEINFKPEYDPQTIAQLIQIYKKHESGELSVWFFRTKDQAREARNACLAAGIPADFVISDHSTAEREEIVERFRNREITVLTNCGCLATGFDCPPITSVMMPFGTGSIVQYLQRIGRALRATTGKSEARIYVFGDAPTIKSGVYRKMTDAVLKNKPELVQPDENDLYDILEQLEYESEPDQLKIKYTKDTIEICEMLRKDNPDISKLIQKRKFPKKYMADLKEFSEHIKPGPKSLEPITNMQTDMLRSHGFEPWDLEGISKSDAQTLIAAISSYQMRHGEFRVPCGQHINKHIREVPPLYLKWLKDKNRYDHPIFKIKKRWERTQQKGA